MNDYVYVVVANWREPYEGSESWTVAAYTTREMAEEHARLAAAYPDRFKNPYDCDGRACYHGVSYEVEAMPVSSSLPGANATVYMLLIPGKDVADDYDNLALATNAAHTHYRTAHGIPAEADVSLLWDCSKPGEWTSDKGGYRVVQCEK